MLEDTQLNLYELNCLHDRTGLLLVEEQFGTLAFYRSGVHGVGMGRVKGYVIAILWMAKERPFFSPVPPHYTTGSTNPIRNEHETFWTWFRSFTPEPINRKGGESV
ncbi:hypothetical protein GCM10028774_41220 [Spirosoma jeollabukense]